MREIAENSWPFPELPKEDGLDINAIFGSASTQNPSANPFAEEQPQEPAPDTALASAPTTAPVAEALTAPQPAKEQTGPPASNPLEAAFAAQTAENAQKGSFEKPPVFYHKGAKEPIDDPSMTFEELRIRKSEDFTDLEEPVCRGI
jgi:hypothetical protein